MITKSEKSRISCEIDMLKVNNPNIPYLELCLMYADENDIEHENIHKFINETLTQKIKIEAEKANMLINKRKGTDLLSWL